jgi:hypothetical protein
MKKCEGKATYPGLVMYSSVETDDKGCDLAEDEAADHPDSRYQRLDAYV